MAVSVALMNRRDTAEDFDVDRTFTVWPIGSATSTWRRVATPCQHSFHHDLGEEIASGEGTHVVGDLTAAVNEMAPGAFHRRLAAAELHLARRGISQFPNRPSGGLACFGPISAVNSSSSNARNTAKPAAVVNAKSPLAHRLGDPGQCDLCCLGRPSRNIVRCDTNDRYLLLHGDPFSELRVLEDPRTLP